MEHKELSDRARLAGRMANKMIVVQGQSITQAKQEAIRIVSQMGYQEVKEALAISLCSEDDH